MSEAALALLNDDSASSEEETPSQRAISLLEGRAEPSDSPKRQSTPSISMAPVGAAEEGLRMVTRAVSGIPGGIAYGGAAIGRALGLNVNPAQTMADVSEYFTHDPISESGKAAQADVDLTTQTLMRPVAKIADRAASSVGTVSPFAESLLREVPAAAGAASGIMGLSPFVSPATQILREVPGAVSSGAKSAASTVASAGRRVAQAGEATSDAMLRAAGKEPMPASSAAPATSFGSDTLSAAAASPDIVAASPEIRAVVQRAAQEGGLNRDVLTRHLEADSLPIKMRLTKGQATQDPTQISIEQNARGKNPELARIFNEQNQNLIDNLDEIRREAAPNVVGQDHVQNGQYLIDAYKTADEPIVADIRAKYKALEEANGGQFPVDGKTFVEAADRALSKKLKGRYVPSQVAGDLADLRETGSMTFEQFENLRTNLAAEARKAERSGDGNAAAAVNIVRESLESLPMTGEAAKIKPLADTARAAAKARFDRLRADPAYRAAVDDGAEIGELSSLADDFVQKYVVKGKAANIKNMRDNLAADPQAAETIAAGALNYVKSKSGVNLYTNEGNFSQAGYNRALSELTPKLEFLLGEQVAERAQALGNVARYTQAQPRGAFVNNSNTFVA